MYPVNDTLALPAFVQIPSSFVLPDQVYDLPQPLLNITVIFAWSFPTYIFENATFSQADLLRNGTCQPQKDYQWGFSITLLFAYLIVTCVFSLVLYAVWLDTFTYHDKDPSHLFGNLTSALEVAAAVQEELGEVPMGCTNSELNRILRARGASIRPRRHDVRTDNQEMAKSAPSVHVTSIALEDCPPAWIGRETSAVL